MARAKILVVDDEKLIRWSLEQDLTRAEYEVICAETGEAGLQLFREEQPEMVLLDIRLPGMSGIDLLRAIREVDSDAQVIMITAHGDVQSAVTAMKLGAYDYLEKPFEMERVRHLVEKALETAALKREVRQLRGEREKRYGFDQIIGRSERIRQLLDLARKVARSDATTVLLEGESGTGKDLLARVIHYQSDRAGRPFMEVNCSAIPDTLIESELFGHEKGAFTDAKSQKKGLLELADGGTVYLDEIGEMQPAIQSKLLKVIEEKAFKRVGGARDIRVNVRFIAATNRDLAASVREGRFREDLYYRLKVIPVVLPPLRDRREDILPLARQFIAQFNREFRRNVQGISPEAEELLLAYHWPGNVRELRNVIERALILETEEQILPEHLPLEIQTPSERREAAIAPYEISPEGLSLEAVEKDLIQQALALTHGNQVRAARLLNITRDVLRYRMKKHGLL